MSMADIAKPSFIDSIEAIRKQSAPQITLTQTIKTLTAGISLQLAAANKNRRYLGIVNIGTSQASLGVGTAAILNQGWPLVAADSLGAQGGALLWEGNAIPTQAFYAIASAVTTIVVLEG